MYTSRFRILVYSKKKLFACACLCTCDLLEVHVREILISSDTKY